MSTTIPNLKTAEELGEELCSFCPLDEGARGVKCYGGSIVMCEGSRCSEAYDNYLDQLEEDNK